MVKVLLAGESWVSGVVDHKGFDAFPHTQVHIGCEIFLKVLREEGHDVTHLKAHDVAAEFPLSRAGLAEFDVIVLSDIGSNSLLLPPVVFELGQRAPNRLKLLKEWVEGGGGLMMAGGYLSFQGFQAKANYAGTPIDEILPVQISRWDDRIEAPEGAVGRIVAPAHDVLIGLDEEWPALLGYQQLTMRPEGEMLAEINGDPLLSVRHVGAGRTLAFASDISPHWAPQEFMDWDGYSKLFNNCVRWLARA